MDSHTEFHELEESPEEWAFSLPGDQMEDPDENYENAAIHDGLSNLDDSEDYRKKTWPVCLDCDEQVREEFEPDYLMEDSEDIEAAMHDYHADLGDSGGRKITCPVCLYSDEQITRNGRQLIWTACGHIFCNVCIEGAIQTQQRCPTCRKTLTRFQIYLL